jgi:PAS domain S-box-containing protein
VISEYRIVQPNGTTVWIQNRSQLIRDASGKPVRSEGILTDITGKEIERLAAITLRSIGEGVITTDPQGRVEMLNRVAQKLTGWKNEEASGHHFDQVFVIKHAETGEVIPHFFATLQAQSAQGPTHLPPGSLLVSRSGREHRIEDSAARIHAEYGEEMGIVVVFRDVTEELMIREQLLQTQKMEAIGQLAGGVAHDFNNMLAVILSSAEILALDSSLSERAAELVSHIHASAIRSADMTSKLLTFARKGKPLSTPVDLYHIVKETADLLKGTLDKRIEIKVTTQATHHTVIGDNSQLQNALLNMGINAAHAMPDGGELSYEIFERELDAIYCQASPFDLIPGPYLEIQVRDTGKGMPRSVQQRIFEPFFSTKGEKGTGLGLAAVYGTLVEHRGAITVYSEEGEGTLFHLYLPLSDAQKVKALSPQEVGRGHGRILLVDDEELIRITGQMLLEEMGYEVLLAEDGQQALTRYQSEKAPIDLVILDMIMPGMSGRETFDALRAYDPDCRIVLASGFSREQDVREMKKRGLAGKLMKPFSRHELWSVLQQVLTPPL